MENFVTVAAEVSLRIGCVGIAPTLLIPSAPAIQRRTSLNCTVGGNFGFWATQPTQLVVV